MEYWQTTKLTASDGEDRVFIRYTIDDSTTLVASEVTVNRLSEPLSDQYEEARRGETHFYKMSRICRDRLALPDSMLHSCTRKHSACDNITAIDGYKRGYRNVLSV